MVFAVALTSEMADEVFEVLPSATTVSATVSLSVSVEVAILKMCVVLSVAPLELYDDTSPFRTSETELACGTTSGDEKWNL
jgi:hypothetical protein